MNTTSKVLSDCNKLLGIVGGQMRKFSMCIIFMCICTMLAACQDSGRSNNKSILGKSKYKKGDYVVMGQYEQDGNLDNGPEPIEWEVLGSNENGTLLISRYVLDVVPYDDLTNFGNGQKTWEICSLRAWLNSEFFNTAFSDSDKDRISEVKNSNNAYYVDYEAVGGNDTMDKIFCLSLDEVCNFYTFEKKDILDEVIPISAELVISPTAYAEQKGVACEVFTEEILEKIQKIFDQEVLGKECLGRTGTYWWLRTPGMSNSQAAIITYYGQAAGDQALEGRKYALTLNGYNVIGYVGVRPALYIKK